MKRFLNRLRAPKEMDATTLDNTQLVLVVQEAYEHELKRLDVQGAEAKIRRIGPDNYIFTEIPEDDAANAQFMHRGVYHGPRWREIMVEERISPQEKLFAITHDALHALSADEENTGGMRAYDWTLRQWGYSGLDEAITDHFARHVITTRLLPKFNATLADAFRIRNENHSYSYLVEYLERIIKSIAEATRAESESEDDSYSRTRDFIYKQYLFGNREGVLHMLHTYVGPGTGTLFAAVPSPRGKKGSPGNITHADAKQRLHAVQNLSDSLRIREPEFDGRLTKTIYKPYLDLKNYPGYPDHINERFVAKIIHDHHAQKLVGKFSSKILSNPIDFDFSDVAITDIYRAIGEIDEDLSIIDRNNFASLQANLGAVYRLRSTLSMYTVLLDRGHSPKWNAIKAAARIADGDPNLRDVRSRGHRAVLLFREFTYDWNSRVYDYLFRRVDGHKDAQIDFAGD